MMTIKSRRELVTAVTPRYGAARGKERERILDEFVASTGYNRKYAIHLLRHPPSERRPQKRRRSRQYNAKVEWALVDVWKVANCIAAKRLVPCLQDFVEALERHGELHFAPETRTLLLSMSISTADRLLRAHRRGPRGRGLATTKPGSLLKKSIPIRTFADWDDARPGFVEVDLVAHCGQSPDGQYLNTLDMTDIATCWTECLAVLNKSQRQVSKAIVAARQRFPFPLLGIDSDNGSEFINANLARYCEQESITFTRSREYHKNDQAHVEQKNWSVVRQFVGYDRYEGTTALRKLEALYQPLRLYINFFQPVQKLVSKERIGSKVKKRYDKAKTPYQRVLESEDVSEDSKRRLREQYAGLNPAALLRQIQTLQENLWRHRERSSQAAMPES
jgi:hypothetical protein